MLDLTSEQLETVIYAMALRFKQLPPTSMHERDKARDIALMAENEGILRYGWDDWTGDNRFEHHVRQMKKVTVKHYDVAPQAPDIRRYAPYRTHDQFLT